MAHVTIYKHMRAIATLAMLSLPALAADYKATTISVRYAPAAEVSVRGTDSVGLRIRLSQGSKAQVWIADNCFTPQASGFIVGQSGEYSISLSTIPGTGRS